MEKRELFYAVGVTKIGAVTMKNSIDVLHKIEKRPTTDLAILLLDVYPKKPKTRIRTNTFAPMFTEASIYRG